MAQTIKLYTRNAAFQYIETLKRNREKRFRNKEFFLEGVHPIEQAIAHGVNIRIVAFDGQKRLSGWAQDMLTKANAAIHHQMGEGLMAELSDREEPCELIMIGGMIQREADDFVHRADSLFVAYDRPQSPGNLGSIIRTCDSMAANGLLITGHAADPYDSQCIRASIGTVFALPFMQMESNQDVLNWVQAAPDTMRPRIIGTSAKGTRHLHEVDLTGPILLAIGNETFGLSKGWKEVCDELVRIPIGGSSSSLNVACAHAICQYEIMRQRGFKQILK